MHQDSRSKPTLKLLQRALTQNNTRFVTKRHQRNNVRDHNKNSPPDWQDNIEGIVETLENAEHESFDTLYKLSKTYKTNGLVLPLDHDKLFLAWRKGGRQCAAFHILEKDLTDEERSKLDVNHIKVSVKMKDSRKKYSTLWPHTELETATLPYGHDIIATWCRSKYILKDVDRAEGCRQYLLDKSNLVFVYVV